MIPLVPILLIVGGAGAVFWLATSDIDPPVPDHPPDLPPNAPPPSGFPRSTGYKRVDAILAQLRAASDSSGIPLGLMVGWIAKESGGKLEDTTSLDERGLFQLLPDESNMLGLDHQRLSTDLTYSINAGLALIGHYSGIAEQLGIARKGSTYFYLLVKLLHSMGTGAVKKLVAAAEDAGQVASWTVLEKWALSNNEDLLSKVKHAPAKWFPFVDAVYSVGKPFGFGSQDSVVGAGTGTVFTDIVDPLDCLQS